MIYLLFKKKKPNRLRYPGTYPQNADYNYQLYIYNVLYIYPSKISRQKNAKITSGIDGQHNEERFFGPPHFIALSRDVSVKRFSTFSNILCIWIQIHFVGTPLKWYQEYWILRILSRFIIISSAAAYIRALSIVKKRMALSIAGAATPLNLCDSERYTAQKCVHLAVGTGACAFDMSVTK